MAIPGRGRYIILPKDPELAQAVLQKAFEAMPKEQGEDEIALDGETPSDEAESIKALETDNVEAE